MNDTLSTQEPPTTPSGERVGQHPLVIPVSGAGDVKLETDSVNMCGSSVGLPIRVSWGSHGYAGGVIDAEEVRRLRDGLDEWLKTNAEKIVQAREYWDCRRKILRDNARDDRQLSGHTAQHRNQTPTG